MQKIDVQAAIDDARISRVHLLLLSACSAVMLVDGLDIYMFGKFAPAVAEAFGVPVANVSIVLLLQQIGMTVGSLAISPFADRFGRKPLLLFSVLMFGLLTLGGAFAQNMLQLGIMRGLAGLFLAAVVPNTVALLSEFAPSKFRSSFVTIAFAGYMIGGAVAAFFVIFFLDRFGWQGAFWMAGLLALAMVPILYFCAPESLQFRAHRNPADPKIGQLLFRLGMAPPPGDEPLVAQASERPARNKLPLRDVFAGDMARITMLLWAIYFMAMFIISFLGSFAASFFYAFGGVSLQDYATMSLLTLLLSLAGAGSIGFLMDRIKPVHAIAGLYVMEAGTFIAMAWYPFGSIGSLIAFAAFGYCKGAGQSGLNAVCSQVYPTRIRSTGVGWAFGLGRFGGIFAPVAGGILLAGNFTLVGVFALLAICPVVLAALLLALGVVSDRSRQKVEAEPLPAMAEVTA